MLKLGDVVTLFVFTATIVSNVLLVAVTIHSKHLRSACNALIALNGAICALIYMQHGPVLFVFPLVWPNGMSVAQCFALSTLLYVALEAHSVFPIVIALERFLGILFPVWSFHRPQKQHTVTMATPVFVYAVGIIVYFDFVVLSDKLSYTSQLTVCNPPALIYTGNGVGNWIPLKTYPVMGVCWALYIGIWLLYRFRMANQQSANYMTTFRRLSRALTVILVLETAEWVSPMVGGVLNFALANPADVVATVMQVSMWLMGTLRGMPLPALCLIRKSNQTTTAAVVPLRRQAIFTRASAPAPVPELNE